MLQHNLLIDKKPILPTSATEFCEKKDSFNLYNYQKPDFHIKIMLSSKKNVRVHSTNNHKLNK